MTQRHDFNSAMTDVRKAIAVLECATSGEQPNGTPTTPDFHALRRFVLSAKSHLDGGDYRTLPASQGAIERVEQIGDRAVAAVYLQDKAITAIIMAGDAIQDCMTVAEAHTRRDTVTVHGDPYEAGRWLLGCAAGWLDGLIYVMAEPTEH